MCACLVSLLEDAKKWIPVSCRMIGKAINSRYDYRQQSRKRPGYNYYSEKYSHFQNIPLTNLVVKSTRTSVYSKLKNTNEKME